MWAGPLFGNRFVVALWNVTMKLLALGLDGHAAYSGRDLWKVSQKVSIAANLKHWVNKKNTSNGICTVPFQHETLSENVVGTFGAQVDVHDTKMYIFSPATIVASV